MVGGWWLLLLLLMYIYIFICKGLYGKRLSSRLYEQPHNAPLLRAAGSQANGLKASESTFWVDRHGLPQFSVSIAAFDFCVLGLAVVGGGGRGVGVGSRT